MTWQESCLGEHFDIKHGYAFKGGNFGDSGRYVVLTPGNFYEAGGFRHRGEKEKYYTIDPPEDYILEEGDLIVAMTEQGEGLLGSSALVPQSDFYLHNQRLGLVVNLNESTLDKNYLYYLFNTYQVRSQIRASATGLKVKHTAPKRIAAVEVKLPDVTTQKRIAGILSAYDDLIDNNNRRIALLEEAIHRLYREWFVHLRFPGHEHTPVVGGVPEGWEDKPFSSIAEFVNGFAFKPHHWQEVGKPIIKIAELRNGIKPNTPRYEGQDILPKYHIDTGDILFAWSASLDVYLWTQGEAYLNQHIFNVVPQNGYTKTFLFLSLKSAMPRFLSLTQGTTMHHIRRSALTQVTCLVPPSFIMEDLLSYTEPMVNQILNLSIQNEKLTEARDALLPRLMNGSLPV